MRIAGSSLCSWAFVVAVVAGSAEGQPTATSVAVLEEQVQELTRVTALENVTRVVPLEGVAVPTVELWFLYREGFKIADLASFFELIEGSPRCRRIVSMDLGAEDERNGICRPSFLRIEAAESVSESQEGSGILDRWDQFCTLATARRAAAPLTIRVLAFNERRLLFASSAGDEELGKSLLKNLSEAKALGLLPRGSGDFGDSAPVHRISFVSETLADEDLDYRRARLNERVQGCLADYKNKVSKLENLRMQVAPDRVRLEFDINGVGHLGDLLRAFTGRPLFPDGLLISSLAPSPDGLHVVAAARPVI